MAIYSTFFVCDPERLGDGFSGWKSPLATPVRREVSDPFTGEALIYESFEPDWESEESDAPGPQNITRPGSRFAWLARLVGWPPKARLTVRCISSNYSDFLKQRASPFLQECPHWPTKGLTGSELDPLAAELKLTCTFRNALFAPPALACELLEVPDAFVARLATLNDRSLSEIAERWAASMSTPEFTHSAAGTQLNEGWTTEDALAPITNLAALSRTVRDGQSMYLLLEA